MYIIDDSFILQLSIYRAMFGRKYSIEYIIYGFVTRHLEFLLLFSVAIIMTIVTLYTWDVKYQINQNNIPS